MVIDGTGAVVWRAVREVADGFQSEIVEGRTEVDESHSGMRRRRVFGGSDQAGIADRVEISADGTSLVVCRPSIGLEETEAL